MARIGLLSVLTLAITAATLVTMLLIADAAYGGVDGDGDLDAVFANLGDRNGVFLGDGSGDLTCSDVSTDVNDSSAVAVGDVDGDGDLDAVFANFGQPNKVCLGDGSGGFACSDVSTETNQTAGVAVGDVDGDGDLDAVFATIFGPRNRVCPLGR